MQHPKSGRHNRGIPSALRRFLHEMYKCIQNSIADLGELARAAREKMALGRSRSKCYGLGSKNRVHSRVFKIQSFVLQFIIHILFDTVVPRRVCQILYYKKHRSLCSPF